MLASRINVPYSQPSLIYLARCPIVDVGVYRETKVFVNSEMLAANTRPSKNSPRNFSYLASSLSLSLSCSRQLSPSLLFIPIRRVLCPPFGYTMSFALISGQSRICTREFTRVPTRNRMFEGKIAEFAELDGAEIYVEDGFASCMHDRGVKRPLEMVRNMRSFGSSWMVYSYVIYLEIGNAKEYQIDIWKMFVKKCN